MISKHPRFDPVRADLLSFSEGLGQGECDRALRPYQVHQWSEEGLTDLKQTHGLLARLHQEVLLQTAGHQDLRNEVEVACHRMQALFGRSMLRQARLRRAGRERYSGAVLLSCFILAMSGRSFKQTFLTGMKEGVSLMAPGDQVEAAI